jgi:riboflavin synthase
MFTGIIEGLGTVAAIRPVGKGKHFTIVSDFVLEQMSIGDSIAVNGACLTAVSIDAKRFDADVSPETVSKTTFGGIKIGERVNLERALRISDRIDGHLVSGHIDGVGVLLQRKTSANTILVTISAPEVLTRYMIMKGSVAVDGISLTINELERETFEVSIIPHTAKLTTVGLKKIGDSVNIETDMIGKYVERFMLEKQDYDTGSEEKKPTIDRQFLAKSGFL